MHKQMKGNQMQGASRGRSLTPLNLTHTHRTRTAGPTVRNNTINRIAVSGFLAAHKLDLGGNRLILPSVNKNQKLYNTITEFKRVTDQQNIALLDVSYHDLDPTDYVVLKAIVSAHPCLRELVMSGNPVDKISLQMLLDIAVDNPHLVSIQLEDTATPYDWLNKIERQLEKNRRALELRQLKAGLAEMRALRARHAEESKVVLMEFLVHEQVARSHHLKEEGRERALLQKLRILRCNEINDDLRAKRIAEAHALKVAQCLQYEQWFREETALAYDIESRTLYVAQYDSQWSILLEDQEKCRKALKTEQRFLWCVSRRHEKERLAKEKEARVAKCDEEGVDRSRLIESELSARKQIKDLLKSNFQNALERQKLREEDEEMAEQQRRRAEEAARDRKEREDAHKARIIIQMQQDHFRARERTEQEYMMLRKQILAEEECLSRLALGAQKIALDHLKCRDKIFYREKVRYKEMLVKPTLACSIPDTAKPKRYFHENPEAVMIFPEIELFSLGMSPEWIDKIHENETQLRAAFMAAKKDYIHSKNELAKYKADKCNDKLDPKADNYQKKLEVREAMVYPAETSFQQEPILRAADPVQLRCEKEMIWGGSIHIKIVGLARSEISYDHFFADTGDWVSTPVLLPVPLPLSYSLLPFEPPPSLERSETTCAVYLANDAEEEQDPEDDEEEIGEERETFSEFEITLPSDGTVKAPQIQKLLCSMGYLSTLPSLKNVKYCIRRIEVTLSLLVANQGTSTTNLEMSVISRPATMLTVTKTFTVPVFVSQRYLVIPKEHCFLVYEEDTPVEDFRLCRRVKCYDPPYTFENKLTGAIEFLPRSSTTRTLLGVQPQGAFYNGTILIDFIDGYTIDDQVAFVSSHKFMWILGCTLFMQDGANEIEVAKIVQGQIHRTSAMPKEWLTENKTIKLRLVYPQADAALVRRIVTRLRYTNPSKDATEGTRVIGISVTDSEGSMCRTLIRLNVVCEDDPAELVIGRKKIFYRLSQEVSPQNKKYIATSLLHVRIVDHDARIQDDDTDRFLGGKASFSITGGAQKGDTLVLICKTEGISPRKGNVSPKHSPREDSISRPSSRPVSPQVSPRSLGKSLSWKRTGVSLFEVVATTVIQSSSAGHKSEQDGTVGRRSTLLGGRDLWQEFKSNLNRSTPDLHCVRNQILFQGRHVATLLKGFTLDPMGAPDTLTTPCTEIELEFTPDGLASIDSATAILRSIAFASTLSRAIEGERTISISVQPGNTVPKPRVDGTVKPYKYDPDSWNDPMSETITLRVTPELFWVPSVYGDIEYREKSGTVRLAPFDVQYEHIGYFEVFTGCFIVAEIVQGYMPEDVLGLMASAEMRIKSRKEDVAKKAPEEGPKGKKLMGKVRVMMDKVEEDSKTRNEALIDIIRHFHTGGRTSTKIFEGLDPLSKVKDVYLNTRIGDDPEAVLFQTNNRLCLAFRYPIKRKELLTVLKSITYCNNSSNPTVLDKVIRIAFYEGDESGSQTILNLKVQAVNDVTDILTRAERVVHQECTKSAFDLGATPFCLVGDLRLSDPDTEFFDEGSATIELTAGHTCVDSLGFMTEEQQNACRAIARNLRLNNDKLASEWPLPKDEYVVQIVNGNKLKVKDGAIFGTVSFPTVANWGPSNNITFNFGKHDPPVVSIQLVQYLLSCVTYRQTGDKFKPGLRLYTITIVDKQNPVDAKLRYAVEAKGALFYGPSKGHGNLCYVNDVKYVLGNPAVAFVNEMVPNFPEKDKAITSGFLRIVLENPGPKDSLCFLNKVFTIQKEGKDISLYNNNGGKVELLGKYKATSALIQVDFSYLSKITPQTLVQFCKSIGFKALESCAEKRVVAVEVAAINGGDPTLLRVTIDVKPESSALDL